MKVKLTAAAVTGVLAVVILNFCQCATFETIHSDPRAEYVAASETFVAIVDTLADMREKGMFDEDEIEVISVLIESGQNLLETWYAEVEAGVENPGNWAALKNVIRELTAFKDGEV